MGLRAYDVLEFSSLPTEAGGGSADVGGADCVHGLVAGACRIGLDAVAAALGAGDPLPLNTGWLLHVDDLAVFERDRLAIVVKDGS